MTSIPDRWAQPIFVASMGRSGSTLLQRLLNVHPQVTIWGEHAGFLTGILQSYALAREPNAEKNLSEGFEHRDMVIGELSEKDVFKPWVSPFTADDLEHGVRSMMVDLFTAGLSPEIRWGFKEIRYTNVELRTLMAMFPQAQLVVLARDIEGYAQSRFFAFGNTDFDFETDVGREQASKRVTNMMNGWVKRYQGLVGLLDQFSDRSITVAYGDLVAGSSRPDRLFDELGEERPRREAIEAVLGAVSGSSYRHNSAARASRSELAALLELVDVDRDEIARLSQRLGLS